MSLDWLPLDFRWPAALLALLLVPLVLAGYVVLQRRRRRYALRFTNLDLLANVVDRSPARRRHVPAALFLVALATLLVGLARPELSVAVPREQAAVVLAVDTSGSMRATDVEPSRLAAARAAAQAFLDRTPGRLQVGLVAFSGEAHVLTPPTLDRTAVERALDGLAADGGTAVGDAIVRSLEAGGAGADGTAERPLAVLLLSDGAPSPGTLDPGEAAARAAEAGVAVHTVALGTSGGTVEIEDGYGTRRTVPVPPDEEALRSIAARTGGEFFEAPTEDELVRVYESLGSQLGFERERQEVTVAFLAAGAAAMLLAGTLSALWFGRLP